VTGLGRHGLGRVGVWLSKLGAVSADEARAAVAEIEDLGYATVWIGETSTSKEALTSAGILLAATRHLVVATGIASVWVRDATTTNAAALALGEAYPGRFVLGLGVSHRSLVAGRGHIYAKPLTKMREYLDELDAAEYAAPRPDVPVERVLAALAPRMLELSRDRAAGAHTYFMPVEHTRRARQLLGERPLLAPEQAFVLSDDMAQARTTARRHMEFYLGQPNYVKSLAALGFRDDDVSGGGSDRLVDALVACGDVPAVVGRVREQLAAGADHVAVQPLGPDLPGAVAQLRALAPAVTSGL
jgi:probable F420-dependent oxidoreductase